MPRGRDGPVIQLGDLVALMREAPPSDEQDRGNCQQHVDHAYPNGDHETKRDPRDQGNEAGAEQEGAGRHGAIVREEEAETALATLYCI